jgi:hypothetical protein
VRGDVQQIFRRRRLIPQTIDHFPFVFNFSSFKRPGELFIVFVLVVRNCFTLAFVIVAAFLRVWRKPGTITKAKVKQFRTTRTKTMKSSPGLLKEEKLKTNGKWSIVCGISRRRRKICCTSPRTCR